MKGKKRLVSLLLCGVMLFSCLPQAVFAEEVQGSGIADGLCEHHTEHTAECGYSEGNPESSCTYVCEICNPQEGSGQEEPNPEGELQSDGNLSDSIEGEKKTNPPSNTIQGSVKNVPQRAAALPAAAQRADHQHPVCVDTGSCTDPNHDSGHGDVVWTAWESSDAMPENGGNYYLTADVFLSKTWMVPEGKNVQICLNGHAITFTEGLENWDMSEQDIDETSRSVICVPADSTLTITDCQEMGKITGGTGTFVKGLYGGVGGGYCGGGLFVEGTLNLYKGSIEENHCPMYRDDSSDEGGGGGVFVNGGTFNMYGGILTKNSAKDNGNGVFCWSGQFNMYDGSITENGREITGWRLTYMGNTGGVGILNGAKMTMSGGEISNNLASYVGGIYVNSEDGTLTLLRDAEITDHTCSRLDYGGILVIGALLDMRGGEVSGNREGAVTVLDSNMRMTGGNIQADVDGSTYGICITDLDNSDESHVSVSGGAVSCGGNKDTSDIVFEGKENSSLKLSGAPEIQSISLDRINVIELGGQLTYPSPITVKKNGGGVITSGWTEKMSGQEPESYFKSWSADYQLGVSAGELLLTAAETEHVHDDITFDHDLSTDVKGYYMSYQSITEAGAYRLTTSLSFGEENSIGNTLFIGDLNEKPVAVNLCLNGYELSRKQSGDSGPVLCVAAKAALSLYRCKNGIITGNSSENGGIFGAGVGGGIVVLEGGVLNLHGGGITKNTAELAGGGIYADNGSMINLWGGENPVVITDNTVGEDANNLYLAQGADLVIQELPAQGSKIGISMETPGLFATVAEGVNLEEAVKFFTSDDPNYGVTVTDQGLELTEKYSVPDISINYDEETLTGFEDGGSYTINGISVTVDENKTLSIKNEWLGTSISIVRKGTEDEMLDSDEKILNIPERLEAPSAPGIDYEDETLTGDGGTLQYSLDGESWKDYPEDTAVTSFEWNGQQMNLLFRTKATDHSFASKSVSLTIPARPAAPEVSYEKETVKGKEDGKITGLTKGTAYEISNDNGANWEDTEVEGTEITGLAPGNYLLRAAATERSFRSEHAQGNIDDGDDPTYTLNVTAPVFDSVIPGYTRPEAKPIKISSTGNSDASISQVTVDSEDFEIGGSGNVVTASGSIDTWTIQPKEGLDVGTYTAVITVVYNNGAKATGEVSFTVTRPSGTIYYALLFETNGGSKISAIVREAGSTIDLSEYVPVRKGYDFTGWYEDEEQNKPVTELLLDATKTIYAGWKTPDTRKEQKIYMTVPAQERDLKNGSRTTKSKDCFLKLGFAVEDKDLHLTYATSDSKVATVEDGKITYQGVGTCIITVTAKATDTCKEASLAITVTVGKPGTPTFTPSVTARTAQKAFKVTSSTVRGVDGWEVQYSVRPNFWKATTKDFPDTGTKLYRKTCTTLHSGTTYYIHVRGYQIVDGEKVYSDWSPMKSIKTKPGTPTFTPSVTARTAQKAFTVTSSTVRGVDGWEVQYSIRNDFWRATTKDFPDMGAKLYRETCTTVHSNMTYYIHVRGYQVVDGEKVYSDWSPVKIIRTR